MAYDSKTFGQSPFGAAKPDDSKPDTAKAPAAENDLDKGPKAFAKESAQTSKVADESTTPTLKNKFPNLSSITGQFTGTQASSQPDSQSNSQSDSQSATKTDEKTSGSPAKASATKTRSRASKSTQSTARKSKKGKSAKTAELGAIEAAEAEVARRFQAENRNAYLSLLYKTGISGLIWAVLRLLHYELPKDVFAIINIIIHPLVIATVALLTAVALTFWLRYLLNDLAIHTQRLHADAETPDGKNYRPTLEIVGDSLEYNPQLRKNFAALFNVASILICSLASYLMIFAAFPE